MSRFSDYLTFVTIVDTQSITEAAKQLHRSVSAISKQLSKLEENLSAHLINRSTQSLSVTEIGEKFYLKCKDVLAAVDSAEQSVKDELSIPSGKITLSFPEILLRSPFMEILEAFTQQYPSVTLDLRVSNRYDDIIEDQIDFAFRMGKLSDSRLTAITLANTYPIFCASPDYIHNNGSPSSFEELVSNHRLILPTYLNLSEQVRRFFSHSDKLPFSLENAHLSNSEAVLYESVIRGLGVSIMLDISITEDLKKGKLIKLFPQNTFPELSLCLLYNNSDYMPEKLRVFKYFINEKIGQYFNKLS